MEKLIDKQYVELMVMNYVGDLVTRQDMEEANYTIKAKEDIVEKVLDCLKPNFLDEYYKNDNISISNIKYYDIGNYYGIEYITLNKDSEFLTNIIY